MRLSRLTCMPWLDYLCRCGYGILLVGEVPEHLDEVLRQGVQIDMELTLCSSRLVSYQFNSNHAIMTWTLTLDVIPHP